jgi:hypothetical protein
VFLNCAVSDDVSACSRSEGPATMARQGTVTNNDKFASRRERELPVGGDITRNSFLSTMISGSSLSEREVAMKAKTWAFAVVGCDLNEHPKYLGFAQTYEDAIKLQENMSVVGWRRVAVFDATFHEVKAKPIGGS